MNCDGAVASGVSAKESAVAAPANETAREKIEREECLVLLFCRARTRTAGALRSLARSIYDRYILISAAASNNVIILFGGALQHERTRASRKTM